MTSAGAGPASGFTLIEVLVALTILSVSLLVLLGVFGDSFQRAGRLRGDAAAMALAQSLLAATSEGTPLRAGDMEDQSADGFRWHLRIAPYVEGKDGDAWPLQAFRVSVDVFWRDGNVERSVALDTLRLAPREAR